MNVLTYKDIMKLFGISKQTTYRILHDPECPIISSSPYLVLEQDLINFMKLKEQKTKQSQIKE